MWGGVIQYRPETAIYLGMFCSTWGHVITDNIRRLWFLYTDEFNHEFKNCSLVYIPIDKKLLTQQKNFRRLLEILEVDVDKIQPITQPTQFENIILPDSSYYLDKDDLRKFTGKYRETIERIRSFALKNRVPTSIKKFYYLHGKRQIGEERIAQYFQSKGYAVILPENLTVDEQLNLMINCKSFASTMGSCAHNSVFLHDGTETIFIPRNAKYFGSYQTPLNYLRSLKSNYVDATFSIFHEPFCYILGEQLKRFFGDKFNGYEETDFKIFLQYVRSCMSTGLRINADQVKYYGAVFTDFLAQLGRRKDLLNAYGITVK